MTSEPAVAVVAQAVPQAESSAQPASSALNSELKSELAELAVAKSHEDGESLNTFSDDTASAEVIAIRELNTSFENAIDRVAMELSSFHARSAAQEELIARMHARIEILQNGETKKLLKPVSTQLVALYSDLEDTASSLGEDATVSQFRGLLSNFSMTVEQILDNLGLTSLDTSPGDEFEPRLHQAIKKIDTTDAAVDRKIAAVLRQGFTEDGEAKPIVHSRVSVYRLIGEPNSYAPSSQTDEQGAPQP